MNESRTRHAIVQPPGWKPARGFANGVKTGRGTLYLGGQIGWDGDQRFVSDDFVAQMEQALTNIAAIVGEAGGTVTDITRLTWFITDKGEYLARQREVGEAYRRVMGRHFPAMSVVVVSALIEDRAVIEIEATAELAK